MRNRAVDRIFLKSSAIALLLMYWIVERDFFNIFRQTGLFGRLVMTV